MKPKLRNSYRRALITIGWIVDLALLAFALSLGFSVARIANPALVWISLIFLAFFGLVWLIIWGLGVLQVRRAAGFLASERPLVRWTYSSVEWQQFKEVIWQEEAGDWKVQLGCLQKFYRTWAPDYQEWIRESEEQPEAPDRRW